MTSSTGSDPIRIASVCAECRSLLAYVFARRELEELGLEDRFDLITGGHSPLITSTRKSSSRWPRLASTSVIGRRVR